MNWKYKVSLFFIDYFVDIYKIYVYIPCIYRQYTNIIHNSPSCDNNLITYSSFCSHPLHISSIYVCMKNSGWWKKERSSCTSSIFLFYFIHCVFSFFTNLQTPNENLHLQPPLPFPSPPNTYNSCCSRSNFGFC